MPWYNGTFPTTYKNQPLEIRNKATEIANELLMNGASEGVAIATGLKKARELYAAKGRRERNRKQL
jgi:uncharacterized protein YdaT